MKRICLILTVLLPVLLSACNGQMGEVITQADTTTDTQKTAVGYGFTADSGLRLGVGMPMDEAADKLGLPQSVQTSESCAFGGTDRAYAYPGFQVCTNDESGREQIYEITLTDDMYSTQEGIRVGTDTKQVTAIYGPSQGVDDALLCYRKDGMRLLFVIRDGVVSAIRYTAL